MKTARLLIFTKRLKSVWVFTLVICCACIGFAESKFPARETEDAQSRSTPTRPPAIEELSRQSRGDVVIMDYQVLIEDVPAYIWYRGCGPTSVGMLMGYYDGQGYYDLVPGVATSQTSAVDDMIASSGHYTDYSLPKDYYPNLLADGSETNAGGCHADNSVADFFQTSRSSVSNYWGWSWYSKCDDALQGYVNHMSTEYTPAAQNQTWASMSWERLTQEIDSNHPCIFLVDSSGSGSSDHFVPIIGYGEVDGTNMYACYDTWDWSIHWYAFRGMSASYTYGIYGATYFSLAPLPESEPSKAINPSPTNGATGVSTSPTLTWSDGGGAQGFDVYFGTNPTPGVSEFETSQSSTTYDPGALDEGANYYWRIDATNTIGTTTGDVWSFTTEIPIIHYVSPSGGNVSPYTSWANAARSIQNAIDVTAAGDTVLVSNGTYTISTQLLINRPLTVRSVNGALSTTVDVQTAHRCLRIYAGAMMKGFSFVNGSKVNGGGVFFDDGGSVEDCVIESCTADYGGGAYMQGGGTLRNCLIIQNSAGYGGGVYVTDKSGGVNAGTSVESCSVADNQATGPGGGIYINASWIDGQVLNSVVYSNTCGTTGHNYVNMGSRWGYTNTCTSPEVTGDGNITNEPAFTASASGDYSLSGSSPCIDEGTNRVWMTTSTDVAGNDRILNGIVDMGAFEYDPSGTVEHDLDVASAHGSPSPSVGSHTYEENTIVPCSVASPLAGGGTQQVCSGWAMSGHSPLSGTTNAFSLTITNNASLTWLWTTNVMLTTMVDGPGSLSGDSDGWYPLGGGITVTAAADPQYYFVGWSGNVPSGETNENPLTLTMSQTRLVVAHFSYHEPDSDEVYSSTSGVSTCWAADPGGVYQLLGCSDLANPVWSNVSVIVTATADTVILIDTNRGAPCMMYRAMRIFP